MVYCKAGKVPTDWRSYFAIRFHLHRSAEQKGKPLALDVMALDQDGRGQLWRRLDLDFAGWARIDMPLRFFGPGDGRLIRWDEVQRLGFRFQGIVDVGIDSIALLKADDGKSAVISHEELSRLAFGKGLENTLAHQGDFLLISDLNGVDFGPLVSDLKRVQKVLSDWLPLEGASNDLPVLLVFGTEQDYRSFSPRYAAAMKREIAPPTSSGFTLNGIAMGFWDPGQGLRRPTFLHEFVHSVIENRLRLQNRSEWFQEGFGNLIQSTFRPQPGFSGELIKAVNSPAFQLPLKRVCNGDPIPISHYWQAMTLCEMMVGDPVLRSKIPALIRSFRQAGNTNLDPHIQPVLGLDWPMLEAKWKASILEKYKAPQ